MNTIEQSTAYVDFEVKTYPLWRAGSHDIENHRRAHFSKSRENNGVFYERRDGETIASIGPKPRQRR